MKTCLQCGKKFNGHPNKKFCRSKGRGNCKDSYHNETNPRGYFAPTVDGMAVPKGYSGLTDQEIDECNAANEMGWDGHKDTF